MTVAEQQPAHPVLATALEAHANGLCVIRARTNGTKAPLGEWERWQTDRPTVEQLHQWFGNGHPGIGIVCGEISGNVEMLELEGVAVAGGVGLEVTRMARATGIGHIIERLRAGYFERTPSKGIHWIYRVAGEPIPGNTKLARRPATAAELAVNPDDKIKTLIETRGEGGFTVIAPSHGPTHPSGAPWTLGGGGLATIPTLTADERKALHDVCRGFDTYSAERIVVQPVAPTKRITPKAFTGTVGDSWMDGVVEHLAATVTWDGLLTRYGWRYLRDDRHGSALYCRPGKDDGVSGWVKNDRLNVFSSSTPLDSTDRTTHDRLEVIAAYEHRGDRQEAARAIAEAAGILAAWKAARDAQGNTAAPAANVDTTTGEIIRSVNLPDEFWNARTFLQHIRQAAHARTACADAVLLVTMVRVASLIPPTTKLPAIVASEASLNLFGAIVSQSGGGKSSGKDIGVELVPIERKDIVDSVPPGSGEGLVEMYFEWVDDDDGGKKKVKRQTKTSAFVWVDEGQSLIKMGERSGATVLQTLRSAWSGQTLGQSNAAQETKRVIPAHKYRMGLVMGFQLQYAAEIIADSEGGTPQRFLFVNATDPSVPKDAPEWPGALRITLPPTITTGHHFTFDPDIASGIRERHHAKVTGARAVDDLDGHVDLVQMKVAAVFAVLDGGRDHVAVSDWELAGEFMATSSAVRQWAIDTARTRLANDAHGRAIAAAMHEQNIADTLYGKAVKAGAKAIAKRLHRTGEPASKTELKDAVAGRDKRNAPVDDMLDFALGKGWIKRSETGWEAGESRPL